MKAMRTWGGPVTTALGLFAMVLLSAGASWAAKRQSLPAALQFGSGWFFHVAFGVFVFVVVYALSALVTATIRAGGPPKTMSGLGFSWDWEQAAEIANSGVKSLEVLNKQLSKLRAQVEALTEVERETQEAVSRIAAALPSLPTDIQDAAAERSERLAQLLEREGDPDQAASAIAGFRANLAALDRLHVEMTKT